MLFRHTVKIRLNDYVIKHQLVSRYYTPATNFFVATGDKHITSIHAYEIGCIVHVPHEKYTSGSQVKRSFIKRSVNANSPSVVGLGAPRYHEVPNDS